MLYSLLAVVGGSYALQWLLGDNDDSSTAPTVYGNQGVSGARYGGMDACIYGALSLTRDQWQQLLNHSVTELRALFAMPDMVVRSKAKGMGFGNVGKDDIRHAMKAMPGWYQKAYADRYFSGNVQEAVNTMGKIAGITIPLRA